MIRFNLKALLCLMVALVAANVFACAAITKKGTVCKRAPSPGSAYCWQHGGTTKAQRAAGITAEEREASRCKAITRAGTQCLRDAKDGHDYCWQHLDWEKAAKETETVSGEDAKAKSQSPKNDPAAGGQCTAITKKGKRCSRKAMSGSTKCWQHAQ